MIPKNITRNHVLQAIKDVANEGIPSGRTSKKFSLLYNGRRYPPKLIVSRANVYANGHPLDSSLFSGGKETNSFLQKLGFTIEGEKGTSLRKRKQPRSRPRSTGSHQGIHCKQCKVQIEHFLTSLYGEVKRGYQFEVGVLPHLFLHSPFGRELQEIYKALQDYLGHQQFVRAAQLPPVDFYVPNPGFIVEFDEPQHFTVPRGLALSKYPHELTLGFSKEKWHRLCEQIKARDPDPVYRDEQRAWYDTLRDFLPTIVGLKPTTRLYARDQRWCELDPESPSDLARFKSYLTGCNDSLPVEVRADDSPCLARIIIAGVWDGDVDTARRVLNAVCEQWPEGVKVDCLITCGAFLYFEWPCDLPEIEDNLFPPPNALNLLQREAEAQCNCLLDGRLRTRLKKHVRYLTVGIDAHSEEPIISLSSTIIRHPHVELVTLIDLETGSYHWTGKSYPTSGQETGLLRVADIDSHFLELACGTVMILGCHDLSMFNPRGIAVTKAQWRQDTRRTFLNTAKSRKPKLVLHHPHTTDSVRTWLASWNRLSVELQSVERFIGAGRYHREEGVRSDLSDVLSATKQGASIDFVIHPC